MSKPVGYWTKEKCFEEASKYNSRVEFRINSNSAYGAIYRNKWTDILNALFPLKIYTIPTKEECAIEALKYKTRTEFYTKSKKTYMFALNQDWTDEICKHMIKVGNRRHRCVYVYEFSDNYAYVGLTYDMNIRIKVREKTNNDAVTKHITETNLIPILKVFTDYIIVEEAVKLEKYYVDEYRKNGWNILNRHKTGSLGFDPKLTKEKCAEEALKYKYLVDFRKQCSGAYNKARKNGWMDEIGSHLLYLSKPNGYWTFEKCAEEASKYKSREEFSSNASGAYAAAKKNKWLDDIIPLLHKKSKPSGYWTFEKCVEEASKYKKRVDFLKKSGSAYQKAYGQGWLKDIYLIVGL